MSKLCLLILFIGVVASQRIRCPPRDWGNAVLQPDPRSCSSFYICSNGIPYKQNCPGGLQFNPRLRVCDWPDRAGCKRLSNADDDHQVQ